jgi:acyl-CoA reductase-like NAD-dependent aldehyde dehydrogenase
MECKIFFGDVEVTKTKVGEIKNPYTQNVVSIYPICDASDAKEALNIAQKAFYKNKDIPLSQRIEWVEDVIENLKRKEDEFAKIITDEIAKPLKFAKVEVQRCIETLRIAVASAIEFGGETFNSDAMPSGRKLSVTTKECLLV